MFDKYVVIGNPIEHSLSPLIHTHFAKATGEKTSYEKVLAPLDRFDACIKVLQQQGVKGANVTAPFKGQAFALMDECSERARIAGAVNTITFMPDGKLVGDNTDGVGLIKDIQQNLKFNLCNKSILIIGTGGAAHGILLPLLQQQPKSLTITNRTFQKSKQLAEQFQQSGNIAAAEITSLDDLSFDVVINTTSIDIDFKQLGLASSIIEPHSFCYDINYSNNTTSFLRWCESCGTDQTHDGIGMLVEQAAAAFAIWRDKTPETRKSIAELKEANRIKHTKY